MAPVLARAPDDVLGSLANAAGDWLVAVAKIFDAHDSVFLDLCQRLLGLGYPEQEDRDDVAGEAINHPVGKATWALLDWWQRGTLEDEQRLPGMLKSLRSANRQVPVRQGDVVRTRHRSVPCRSGLVPRAPFTIA
jgi:hypothetical protein